MREDVHPASVGKLESGLARASGRNDLSFPTSPPLSLPFPNLSQLHTPAGTSRRHQHSPEASEHFSHRDLCLHGESHEKKEYLTDQAEPMIVTIYSCGSKADSTHWASPSTGQHSLSAGLASIVPSLSQAPTFHVSSSLVRVFLFVCDQLELNRWGMCAAL